MPSVRVVVIVATTVYTVARVDYWLAAFENWCRLLFYLEHRRRHQLVMINGLQNNKDKRKLDKLRNRRTYNVCEREGVCERVCVFVRVCVCV